MNSIRSVQLDKSKFVTVIQHLPFCFSILDAKGKKLNYDRKVIKVLLWSGRRHHPWAKHKMKNRYSQRKLKNKTKQNISHPVLSYSHQNFHWRRVSRFPQIGYTLYRLSEAVVLQREAVATAALGGSQRDCVPDSDLAGLLLKMPHPCSGQEGPIGEAAPGQDNVHLVQGSRISTKAPGDACLGFLHWIDQDTEGCVGTETSAYCCIHRAVGTLRWGLGNTEPPGTRPLGPYENRLWLSSPCHSPAITL